MAIPNGTAARPGARFDADAPGRASRYPDTTDVNAMLGPASRAPGGGVVRRLWLSEPAIRLGCLPLDVLAELLLMMGSVASWVQRERAALDDN